MFEHLRTMDRQTRVALIVAGVIGILLFGAIAGVIRQAGWNEGFLVGLLAGHGDGSAQLAPYLAQPGYGLHGWGWHPFGFIGGIFRLLFFGFLIMLLLKFIGFRRWRMHGGPNGGHWQHYGPWQGGPWQQSQPEQGSKPAEGPSQPAENRPQNTSWTNV